MSTSAVAPPHPRLYLKSYANSWRLDRDANVWTVAPHGMVFGFNPKDPERERYIEMLYGNEYLAERELTRKSLSNRQVCRVELIMHSVADEDGPARMGAVFFNGHGRPLLHIVMATLLKDGWPLTQELLGALNVPEYVLIGLSVIAGKLEDYHIILSREVVTVRDGVKYAYPAGRPRREWDWWPAE